MGKKTNLELHGNIWRATVSIPVSLRSLIGKSHYKESLNTSNLDEANRLKGAVITKLKSIIESYKTTGKPPVDTTTNLTINL